MRRLCRQNVEASLLDDAEVQPTFAFSVCKNIAFFPDRTKNPIERFYGAIDEIYTTAWVAFSESISLCNDYLFFISRIDYKIQLLQ
jgi:hypothetical protein